MDAHAYPASLAAAPHDPYMFDTAHFESLLTENSTRLFVADDQLQIKIVEVGHRGNGVFPRVLGVLAVHIGTLKLKYAPDWIFTSLTDLQSYLESTTFQGTRIM